MTPIFLDTVGMLAVWDFDDQWHNAADDAYRRIVSARQSVVTTSYILLECGNAAARRTCREDVCILRRTLELRDELIVPTVGDWTNAWDDYRTECWEGRHCRLRVVLRHAQIGHPASVYER